MTYDQKAAYLFKGQIREWPLWLIHVMFPFFAGLITTGNMRMALALVVTSVFIWYTRILYAASLDWEVQSDEITF